MVRVGTQTGICRPRARGPSRRQLEDRARLRLGRGGLGALRTTPACPPPGAKAGKGPRRRRGVLRLRFPEEKARPAPLTGGDAAAQASFSSRPRPPGLEPLNPHPALRAPAFPRTRGRRRLPRHVPPLHSPGMRRTSNRPTDHRHRAPSVSPCTEQRPLESPHHFRPSRRSTPIGQGRSGCRPIG